jgi:aminopeptidase N/puromycin-sensitive aminopeptidase
MKKRLLFLIASLFVHLPAGAQRLPGGASPDHYSLTFTINFSTNRFEGDELIDLQLTKPTDSIALNAVEIDFHEVTVTAAGQTQAATVALNDKRETATFTVPKTLAEGPAKVHITYAGHLNDKLRGLYLSTNNGRKYAVTQMEATDARVAFPSFDEPAYKATFDISAVVDEGDTAISNNEIISDTPGPGSQHTIRFATTPKMSSYLVALLVGDWKCVHDSVDGIKLGVCTVPGKENLTRFPLEAGKAILHYYNDYYGIKYPLAKLDLIAVPDFQAGAMENWGAITYRETALLVDEKTGSVSARKDVAGTIAHEVAHQWFGDLVTAAWWDDIWLNEGFATWMTPHPLEAWKPEWLVGQDVVDEIFWALNRDAVQNTRPIHQDVETRGQIDSVFDGIAYGKTAAVLHMLELYLGPEIFRAGVNLYLKEHAYGNATATDFWNAMARSSHKPVDQIMPTFVMQAGEPYVTAFSKCVDGATTLALTQKRFFNSAETFHAANEQKWQVPVCTKEIGTTSPANCLLLSESQQSLPLKGCPRFLLPNKGAMGYYRYNYDTAALQALGSSAEQLLTPEERISLVGNEWALMQVGLHGIGDYLALGAQFKNTTGYILLDNFFTQLQFVDRNLVTAADRPAFQQWLNQTFSPVLQQLGYTARPGDTPVEKQKRAVLLYGLGTIGDDPEAIAQANVIAQQYMKDAASLDGSLADAAVKVAARHGDVAIYAQYRAQLKKNLPPEAHRVFFYALAEFPSPELAQQTLSWSLTPDVRNQDLYIFDSLLDNPSIRRVSWDFMRQHFDEVDKKAGTGLWGGDLYVAAGYSFCDEKLRAELEDFYRQHTFEGKEREEKRMLERISDCIALRNQQQEKLSGWLQQNGNPTNGVPAAGAKR